MTLDIEFSPYESTSFNQPTTSDLVLSLGTEGQGAPQGGTAPATEDTFKLIIHPNSLIAEDNSAAQDPLEVKAVSYNPGTQTPATFPATMTAEAGSFDSVGFASAGGNEPLLSGGMFDISISDSRGMTVGIKSGETMGYEMIVDPSNRADIARVAQYGIDFIVDETTALWVPGDLQTLTFDEATGLITSDGLTTTSPHNPDYPEPPPRSSRSSSSDSSSSSSSSSMSSRSSLSSLYAFDPGTYYQAYPYPNSICLYDHSNIAYNSSYFYVDYSEVCGEAYVGTDGGCGVENPLYTLDTSSCRIGIGQFTASLGNLSGEDKKFIIVHSDQATFSNVTQGGRPLSFKDIIRGSFYTEVTVPAGDVSVYTKYSDGTYQHIHILVEPESSKQGDIYVMPDADESITCSVMASFKSDGDYVGKTWAHCSNSRYQIHARPSAASGFSKIKSDIKWSFSLYDTNTQQDVIVGPQNQTTANPANTGVAWSSCIVTTNFNSHSDCNVCSSSANSRSSSSNSSSSNSSSSSSTSSSSSISSSRSSSSSDSSGSSTSSSDSSDSSCHNCCPSYSSRSSSSSDSSSSDSSSSVSSSSISSSGHSCPDCEPDLSEQTLTFNLTDPFNSANDQQWDLTWDPNNCAYDGTNSSGPGSDNLHFAWETSSITMIIHHGNQGRFVTDPFGQVGAACGFFAGITFYHESDNNMTGNSITIS